MPDTGVLVTARFFDDQAIRSMSSNGLEVGRGGVPPDGSDRQITAEMHAALQRCSAWIVGSAPISRELLARYPRLRIVARRGVGVDAVDADAVKELGRVLTITPGCNEATVADHAVGLMLAVSRRFMTSHRRMQSGERTALVGTELYGKTVGLVGLGRIARQVVQRLKGFETRVLACDPFADQGDACRAGIELASLEEVLRQSEFVSLHAPLTNDTRHLINARTIGWMKRGAIFINTARGELVDDAALLASLEKGHLGGAGLDVLGSERDPSLDRITHALLSLSNVVCTQHTAGSSETALARANMLAAACVTAAIRGLPIPPNCIAVDGRERRE